MLSKKKLIIGASTLILAISVVGAAYALPMTNTPMPGQHTDAAKATITMRQNATGPTAEVSIEDMQEAMSKTIPAGQAMHQQTMNYPMSQNSQPMAHNHQGMTHKHQAMSGSAMTGQPMASGHRGFDK
ncbi:hypothetical protein [Desulforamulus aeronauticus]|uniref:Uncharacterized protein n=1 Tax=Desulforamulus aeronauticus DSM 10349 TaxID=1121421 RepID=A0A1M6UMP3_9FIRM|nr:hypothetical protein [Desulforamulus aeronauticus]SHK70467.1 hypothetical protein SAMN02745123_02824 [Desulforamulus aeronauticus DSM 10349]